MASENLLKYTWDTQVMPQAGYGFSTLHSTGYSLIALQEMNLAHRFPPIYWATACLTVNAGADEDNNNNKSTNYGKIASAIGSMKNRGIDVSLPDINNAGFGFKPNVKDNSIIFGLKGMNGIGDDICHLIIQNRPYQSFQDFVVRMFDTKIVKKGQLFQLIKGGCFDSFGDRKSIMKQFIAHLFEPKQKLTTANLNMLIEHDLIPEEFNLNVRFHNYKKYISKTVYKTVSKPKDRLFLLDDISIPFFEQHFTEKPIVDMVGNNPVISEKLFKKEYDKLMLNIKDWLAKPETLQYVNDQLFELEFKAYESESLSKWEMDSLSYYYHEHELTHVNKEKYGIVNFTQLPEQPKVVDTYVSRGIERQVYELTRIAGTVLDKDKNKYTVTLLTTDGVVTIKMYSGSFSHYNKQISEKDSNGKKKVLESSWFTRGNKLLVTGFRRGNQFIPRKYKNSVYQKTISLIKDIDKQGNLSIQTERVIV